MSLLKSMQHWHPKKVYLFLILGGFFIANALLAEFIGVKIFSLEQTFGFEPLRMRLLGFEDLGFNLTAGVLLWPVVFIMTDIINEYYGMRGVRLFSFFAAVLIAYAFLMVFMSIGLVPADFWLNYRQEQGVPNMQSAFQAIFGQGLWIIAGSLVAFLIGQLVDVLVFHRVKSITGERFIWLRATGSTLVSQFIDSFVVLFIAFYLGADWSLKLVLGIGLVNYMYKFTAAILLTPLIYLGHFLIDRYLGDELSKKMREEAHDNRALASV
jgi:queuosine precursor transporter